MYKLHELSLDKIKNIHGTLAEVKQETLRWNYSIDKTNDKFAIVGTGLNASGNIIVNGDTFIDGDVKLSGACKFGNITLTGEIKKSGAVETGEIKKESLSFTAPNIDLLKEAALYGSHIASYTKSGTGSSTLNTCYIDHGLSLSGSYNLQINGTIWVNGTLSVSGTSQIIGPGTIVAGNIVVTGRTKLAPDNLPFIISLNNISESGSTYTSAILYAFGNINISGTGEIYGEVVGRNIAISGNKTIVRN
jgi:cytoskeletal protein CcmA (bactofilin family)